ncbi:g6374 [Coccomyxa viridis]|uniref:G6374 protein n=1 Tax=Coccomyxa viridis TaxID=1274662 RepID=A0ABP1FV91_9CHLO
MAPRSATKAAPAGGAAAKVRSDPMRQLSETEGVLEEGKIFFLYRPRPGREVPRSPEDVQRFYIIMMPTSRKAPVRLLTMGTTKRMPAQGERFWGAVLDTGHSLDDVLKELGPKQNPDQDSDIRLIPAAKVVGEGIYVLYDDGRNVRLLYELEVPIYPQEAQEVLAIYKTGDYSVQVRNPWKDHPRNINPPQRPSYPAKFKQLFEGPDAPSGGYMWAPPKDPAMLDYKNAIIDLIGRSPNLEHPRKGYARSLAQLLDEAVKEDAQDFGAGDEDDAAMVEKLRSDVAADRYGLDVSPAAGGDGGDEME